MAHADVADVVVVGAGTSGATLASRLSDDPDTNLTCFMVGERAAALIEEDTRR